MANERYGMMCPVCKDACYIGKTMGDGIYTTVEAPKKRMRIIWTWMWKHLLECHREFQFGIGSEILFTVIHEGHPDLDMSEEKHWNRHTDDDY